MASLAQALARSVPGGMTNPPSAGAFSRMSRQHGTDINRFIAILAPPDHASTGAHIPRQGSTVARLAKMSAPQGQNTPRASLGNRDVADSSTATYGHGNRLPATPDDEPANEPPQSFREAMHAIRDKIGALKAQGLPEHIVHGAAIQDMLDVAERHGFMDSQESGG